MESVLSQQGGTDTLKSIPGIFFFKISHPHVIFLKDGVTKDL
jgi:hypothetical protein